mmetsp:Transcript_12012/g.28163  ORF Transcript_12012/g.28163 Transcript_12012/m.28163 type:complete len:362 (+) Transcript_12012:199-1284(+)
MAACRQPAHKLAFGKAHFETSDSSSAKWCSGCEPRHLWTWLYPSMFPVCDRATPSKDVIAAPLSRVSALKIARFSSATSARSSWSTMRSDSRMLASVSSCAVSSRPKGSRSPYGISVSMSIGLSTFSGAASLGSGSLISYTSLGSFGGSSSLCFLWPFFPPWPCFLPSSESWSPCFSSSSASSATSPPSFTTRLTIFESASSCCCSRWRTTSRKRSSSALSSSWLTAASLPCSSISFSMSSISPICFSCTVPDSRLRISCSSSRISASSLLRSMDCLDSDSIFCLSLSNFLRRASSCCAASVLFPLPNWWSLEASRKCSSAFFSACVWLSDKLSSASIRVSCKASCACFRAAFACLVMRME